MSSSTEQPVLGEFHLADQANVQAAYSELQASRKLSNELLVRARRKAAKAKNDAQIEDELLDAEH